MLFSVHQCLFCPQTFDSAAAKDDHTLEHFAQETCGECDQKLIRIAGRLYTLHDTVTCIRRELKRECGAPASMTTNQPLAPDECHLRLDDPNYEYEFAADVIGSTSICTEQIEIKAEPPDLEYDQQFDDPFYPNDEQMPMSHQSLFEVKQENNISQTIVSNNDNDSSIDTTSSSIIRFECSDCNESFYSKARLAEHKRQNHGPSLKKFPCKYCKNVLRSESALQVHYKHCVRKRKQQSQRGSQVAVRSSPKRIASTSNSTLVDCTVCGKIYKKGDLKRHMRLNHDPNCIKHTCKYCQRVLLSEPALEIHLRNCKRKAKLEIERSGKVDAADEKIVASDSRVQHEQQQQLVSKNVVGTMRPHPFYNKLKLIAGQGLSHGLAKILIDTGFDCALAISSIDSKAIKSIEEYINKHKHLLTGTEYENLIANNLEFKLTPSHKSIVSSLPKLLEFYKEKNRKNLACARIDEEEEQNLKQTLVTKIKHFANKFSFDLNFSVESVCEFRQENGVFKCRFECPVCFTKIKCEYKRYWLVGNLEKHIKKHYRSVENTELLEPIEADSHEKKVEIISYMDSEETNALNCMLSDFD